jgi:hypothetical protein
MGGSVSADEHLNGQQFGPFYHSTPYAVDDPGFQWPPSGDDWVHVGTVQAATDQANRTAQSSGRRPTMLSVHLAGRVYPHTVSDRIANTISSHPFPEDRFNSLHRTYPERGEGYDIFPYENDAEDPGSTSYVARASAVSKVAARDMRRT